MRGLWLNTLVSSSSVAQCSATLALVIPVGTSWEYLQASPPESWQQARHRANCASGMYVLYGPGGCKSLADSWRKAPAVRQCCLAVGWGPSPCKFHHVSHAVSFPMLGGGMLRLDSTFNVLSHEKESKQVLIKINTCFNSLDLGTI